MMIIEKRVEVHEPFVRETVYVLSPEGRLNIIRDIFDLATGGEHVDHAVETVCADIPFTEERALDAIYAGLV